MRRGASLPALARTRLVVAPWAPTNPPATGAAAWRRAHAVARAAATLAPPPPALDALPLEAPDALVADAVAAFQAGGDPGVLQRLANRTAGPSLPDVLRRAAEASPDALPALLAIRDKCSAVLGDTSLPPVKRAWARRLDDAAAGVLATLSGPALVPTVQLDASPAAPPLLRGLAAAAKAAERVHKTDDNGVFLRRFCGGRMVHGAYHVGMAPPAASLLAGGGEDNAGTPPLLALLFSAALPELPASLAEIDAGTGEGGGWPASNGKPWCLQEGAASRPPADTASLVFYSVSSPHPGFRGLRMGTRIVYTVAGAAAAAAPHLTNVGTLSPIPGFGEWVKAKAAAGELQGLLASTAPAHPTGSGATVIECVAAAAEALGLAAATPSGGAPSAALLRTPEGAAAALLQLLGDPATAGSPQGWYGHPVARAALAPALAGLVRRYLLTPVDSNKPSAGPLCKVAAFHLGNGARMARICFGGDPSASGLARSGSFMVNYLYAGTTPDERGARRVRATVEAQAAGGAGGLAWTMRVGAARYAAAPRDVLAEQDPVMRFPLGMA